MGRRRTLVRLPFFKLRINKQTIFNIVGFFLFGAGTVLLISYLSFFSSISDGLILSKINETFAQRFGGLKILVPFLIVLFSAHFFNTKKLRFIRANVSIGALMIFISVLSVFQSGDFGRLIFTNLSLDFSFIGTIIILGTIFVIGWILLLDTSIDVFLIFIINLFKSGFVFIKQYLFRDMVDKLSNKDKKARADQKEFIVDKKGEERPVFSSSARQTSTTASAGQLIIKPLTRTSSAWVYPPVSLLSDVDQKEADRGDIKENANIIEKTLDSFGIRAKVNEVNYGPAVTQYAIGITMGTKLSRITALSNDLALALAASTGQVRIEAPIPGRSLVGIEIPNKTPTIVTLKQMLQSPLFANSSDPLLVPLGLDVSGQPQATSIGRMPHILIAGATGSGKSVLLNSWISTFLFRTKPDDLRLILVDPKRVELTLYNGIPNLLTEVVVDPEKIISALKWTVSEMENRFKEFSKLKVRNIEGYNALEGVEKKPYYIFIIDELADLMLFAPGDAEDLITRIAQMARATGIHLLLATQRPSVDVITGLMKANIPCRIAFNVSSMIDSRVIIDMPGAEKLLGKGDMLYLPPDQAKPKRIQGPLIFEKEVNQLVRFLKMQVPEVHYTEEITTQQVAITGRGGTMLVDGEERDKLFNQALDIIMQYDKASASLLQRRLSIGYARAARILDQLEGAGYVSPAEGSKPREVIKRPVQGEEEIH